MIKNKLNLFVIFLVTTRMLLAQMPESGKPLVSGGTGFFPLPSIGVTTIGSYNLKGNTLPSLFLASDRWHPGIYRYDCIRYQDEVPVFGAAKRVVMPERLGDQSRGSFVVKDDKLYAFWMKKDTIFETVYNEARNEFELKRHFIVTSLPRRPSTFVIHIENNKLTGYFGIGDGLPTNGPVHWIESKNFSAYGPDGMFVGNLKYSGLYGFEADYKKFPKEVVTQQLTDLDQVMWDYQNLVFVDYGSVKGVLTGSQNGNFLFYKVKADGFNLEPKTYMVDENGIFMRHMSIWARPVIFSSDNSIIVTGEGGIFFYNFSHINEKGQPVYKNPTHALAESPELYGGSLVVPNLVDWDDDGDLDIISGNSIGQILFFENEGTDREPTYNIPQYVKANGKQIHIQPGYRDDIQGPYESRWGYTCPAVFDCNQDGLPDLLTNDSRGKYRLWLNVGTKGKPELAEEAKMFVDGMELHGMWRTRPGVGKFGDDIVYVTLDKDDQFHMYRQLDIYNLEDLGKLQLIDSTFINGSSFSKGGGSGRLKFLIVDWDNDGTKDIMVGTPRHSSIPKKKTGMPYYHGDKGSTVLFLKNVGTEASPVFDEPKMLKYKGETIHFGQHSCAPTVGDLGEENGLDLLVGIEMGRFIFFERSDLSW